MSAIHPQRSSFGDTSPIREDSLRRCSVPMGEQSRDRHALTLLRKCINIICESLLPLFPGFGRSVGLPTFTMTIYGTTCPAHSYNPAYTLPMLCCLDPSPRLWKLNGSGSRLGSTPKMSRTMAGVALSFPKPLMLPSHMIMSNLRLSSYFSRASESIVLRSDSSLSV